MRTRLLLAALFFFSAIAWGAQAHAAVLDSQLDDSAQALKPSTNAFLAAGYIPSHVVDISGVRFRVNASGGGNYECPMEGTVIQYSGTTTPDLWDAGRSIGSIIPATTTPGTNGNCDYTTFDNYSHTAPLSLSPNYYYVFFLTPNGSYTKWVSLSGKAFASTTPTSLFGYRHPFLYSYTWGTNGLDAPYFEFFDTVPPPVMPPAPPVPPDPCANGGCVSNVIFLPGIEGSRLYEGVGCGRTAEEKLWEPFESAWKALRGVGDGKVKDLALDSTGTSACSDIYAKEGDVIDSVNGSNIYASLIAEMNGLKTDGTINDWKPIAYDWRLSLDDLLTKGAQHGDKIFYEEATSTPYIEQTLRVLAASSKTGKVTIIAHSNGGLVAKALLKKLGDIEAASLVDKVIMVGVPQSGAPEDVGAMLVGHDAGIYTYGFPIVSNAAARALVQNSPMAYHLLPSEDYLESTMGDAAHPVIRFSGDGYAKELAAYGSTIANRSALDDFLLAKDGGRVKPATGDLLTAEILNPALVSYANSTHASLDFWTPPTSIEIDQIAGWGVDTVGGVDFYTAQPAATAVVTAFDSYRAYKPIFIEDGDGTVPIPSALMMALSANVKRYWVDLHSYNKITSTKRAHADLFEIPSLQDFIKNILKNSTSTLPAYIVSSQPAPIADNKKLTFFLHSPLTLQLQDASGNVTGLATDGSVSQNIPDSTYGEFGEVKYITVPQGSAYELTMRGQASGTFSLDMQEFSGGTVTASSTIANVPTTENTLANLTISNGIDTASALTVDKNGDGKDTISITPKLGETVSYAPSAPAPAPQKGPVGGGAGGDPPTTLVIEHVAAAEAATPAPVATPEPIIVEEPLATTSPEVATSTVAVALTRHTSLAKKPVILATAVKEQQKAVEEVKGKPAVDTSQTAAVYNAFSQHPFLGKLSAAVYNGLHGFWAALKKFF